MNNNEMTINAKKRLTALFPWLSLIPFVFYIPAGIYVSAPTNVIHSTYPRLAVLGPLSISLALISASTLCMLGIAALLQKQLHGWKKWATFAFTVIHSLLILACVCGLIAFLVLLLTGQLSH